MFVTCARNTMFNHNSECVGPLPRDLLLALKYSAEAERKVFNEAYLVF